MDDSDFPDDGVLVRKAAGGCEASFRCLFDRYYEEIRNFAYQRCHCVDSAGDITQAVFIKVASSLPRFRHQSSFRSWLYKIALNQIRDHLRGRIRYNRKIEICEREAADGGGSAPQAPDALLRAIELVESLPESLREAVVLVCAQGLSHGEAAVILGCAEGTVSWKLSEARRFLRRPERSTES